MPIVIHNIRSLPCQIDPPNVFSLELSVKDKNFSFVMETYDPHYKMRVLRAEPKEDYLSLNEICESSCGLTNIWRVLWLYESGEEFEFPLTITDQELIDDFIAYADDLLFED